jgi:DNA-binding transcriptional regulator YhcF (GntR family)
MAKKLSDLIGQFATIPNSFISQSASLSTEAKWLFVILRYHTNSKTGNAFPSYTKISEITGFHRKTISKSLKELEGAGWLTKQRRFGATTIYALQIPSSSISDTTDATSSSLNSTISSATSATISSSDGVHANQTEEEPRSKEQDRGKRDFLAELRLDPLYSHVDFDFQIAHMQRWLARPENKGRRMTERFVLNWLAKIDRPVDIPVNGNGKVHDEAWHARQAELAKRMGYEYRPSTT